MADTIEKINIIELDIDVDDAITDLASLTKSIEANKKATKSLEQQQSDLAKQGKKNGTQWKKNAEQIELNKVNTKSLSKEYQAQQKVVTGMLTSRERELGTLEKLAQSNKTLRQEQRELNLTTEEGVKRNEEINTQIDENTDFIREHSDSLVQDKINIGNYQSALDNLPPSLNVVKGGLKNVLAASKAF